MAWGAFGLSAVIFFENFYAADVFRFYFIIIELIAFEKSSFGCILPDNVFME